MFRWMVPSLISPRLPIFLRTVVVWSQKLPTSQHVQLWYQMYVFIDLILKYIYFIVKFLFSSHTLKYSIICFLNISIHIARVECLYFLFLFEIHKIFKRTNYLKTEMQYRLLNSKDAQYNKSTIWQQTIVRGENSMLSNLSSKTVILNRFSERRNTYSFIRISRNVAVNKNNTMF